MIKDGYDPKFGARPMKRSIQKYIDSELADAILKGEIKENSKIKLYYEGDKLVIKEIV